MSHTVPGAASFAGTTDAPIALPFGPPPPEPDIFEWRRQLEPWEDQPEKLIHARVRDLGGVPFIAIPDARDPRVQLHKGVEPPEVFGEMKALIGMHGLHLRLDELAGLFQAQRPDKPLCVEQCGLCCVRGTPPATSAEGLMIAGWISSRPWRQRHALTDRLRAWLTVPPRVGSAARPSGLAPAPSSLTPAQRQIAAGRCPFLDEDLRCSIHPVRPLRCRAYSATIPPDEFCQRPQTAQESETDREAVAPESPIIDRFLALHRAWWYRAARWGLHQLGFVPWQVFRFLADDEAVDVERTANEPWQRAQRSALPQQPPVDRDALALLRQVQVEDAADRTRYEGVEETHQARQLVPPPGKGPSR